MTFILGWREEDCVFICADSAVTHRQPPLGNTTSFGELQKLDRVTVEERAVKLLELSHDTLVAVCGDASAALDFVLSVRTRLKFTDTPLRTILVEVAAIAPPSDVFELLFGHIVDGHPDLTVFSSLNGIGGPIGNGFIALGSLPAAKKDLAASLVTAVRQHGLPPDARLGCALVALQSIGITEYLPEHGVGGAFFGARVTRTGVVWQPDLGYLTYRPGMFRSAPIIHDGDITTQVPATSAIEKVRVLIRNGAGIVLSSLGSPPARLLIPPTTENTEEEWQQIVLAAVPPPFHLLVPSEHMGLLNVGNPKAVYIHNPTTRKGAFSVGEHRGTLCVSVVPRLMETLELATPVDKFDLTIVTEDDDGTSAKTYRIAQP
jgi:hypothetical protein